MDFLFFADFHVFSHIVPSSTVPASVCARKDDVGTLGSQVLQELLIGEVCPTDVTRTLKLQIVQLNLDICVELCFLKDLFATGTINIPQEMVFKALLTEGFVTELASDRLKQQVVAELTKEALIIHLETPHNLP